VQEMEEATARIDGLSEPRALQQLAVAYKRQGNLEAAKQALRKAKRILAQQQAEKELPAAVAKQNDSASLPTSPAQPATTTLPAATVPPEEEEKLREHDPSSSEPLVEEHTEELVPDDTVDTENVADDDLEAMMQTEEVSYSVAEMADHEMMTEFRLGGMPVPSDADYQAHILTCKRSALRSKKAGNKAQALQALQQAKQLEQVRVALSQMNEGLGLRINADADGWIETLTAEESELLGEFLTKPMDQASGPKKDLMEDILEELADFMEDPVLLMDAIDMGMEVPSLADVQAEAEDQRRLALEHKQAGNLEGAKAALRQSKQLAVHAQKLEGVFDQIEQQKRKGGTLNVDDEGNDDNSHSEGLKALLEAEEKSAQGPKPTKKAVPKKAVPATKSSKELKQEAIRLRDEKKIAEAAKMLKLYKAALKCEQEAAELQRRQQVVKDLQHEIEHARQQIRVFEFYKRFVDADTQQISMWHEYITNCSNASNLIQVKGPDAVQIVRKRAALLCVQNCGEDDFNATVTNLVEQGSNADPADERLEVTILDLQKIGDNTNLQKLLKKQKREMLPSELEASKRINYTVRVEVTLQLPPNEHEVDKSIELVFEPTVGGSDSQSTPALEGESQPLSSSYTFDEAQYVNLVRGTSAYGKIIRRRIERNKKIQIHVYHVAVPPKKKGGFWSSRSSKTDEALPPPTLLGKIVVGLQDLLTRNCVGAGDFPLMNGSGTKALGGILRLGVRTGRSFGTPPAAEPNDNAAAAGVPDEGSQGAELVPYDAMVFSLKKATAP
jgi:tetratricopeptide (TPR) repeat protein